MEPSARVILDSVSERGHRLTTLEVVMHRFVLAEFNTHRMFSRNSASSRAIPVKKQLDRITNEPTYPISWPAEKPGMQGGEEMEGLERQMVVEVWDVARKNAVASAEVLANMGVHKSVVNRLLEPFMWHTVIVSSTEWDNFWRQRCSPLAQPEMKAAAEAMHDAYESSTPSLVQDWDWHLPYIDDDDRKWAAYEDPDRELGKSALPTLCKISVARCARVSYLTHDGRRDRQVDLGLYEKLISAEPPHASPLEHVAKPAEDLENWPPSGNFRGWEQLRHTVLGF